MTKKGGEGGGGRISFLPGFKLLHPIVRWAHCLHRIQETLIIQGRKTVNRRKKPNIS